MGRTCQRLLVTVLAVACVAIGVVSTAGTAGAASAPRAAHLSPRPRPSVTSQVVQIAAGHAQGCAVLASTSVECWGSNKYGQLGDGTYLPTSRLVTVLGLHDVRQVELGYGSSCALLRDGTVRCWGWNAQGQLGDASTASIPRPVVVRGLRGVTEITVGFEHACALLGNETVRCWGWNYYGQLGDGSNTTQWTSVAVKGLHHVLQVDAGYGHTCAVLRGGTVRCWGWNNDGELGTGTTRSRSSPVAVKGLSHVRNVALGFASTCAVLTTGAAECWGKNNYGQLGDGGLATRHLPTRVHRLAHATQLALGFGHACALLTTHRVACWGWNGHGQLGTGTRASHLVATPTASLRGVLELTAGDDNTCALLHVHLFSCWGWNHQGQLGRPSSPDVRLPPFLPAAPAVVVAHARVASAAVGWSPSRLQGVTAISSYVVTAKDLTRPSGSGQSCTWTGGARACTVPGLIDGDRYRFAVAAVNAAGVGPDSIASNMVTPADVPGATVDVTAQAGNGLALVQWTAPPSDGGSSITSYVATASDSTTPAGGGQSCTWTSGPLRCTVHDLANGDSYTFVVTATNRVGTSADSLASNAVTPQNVPDSPTGVTAIAGNAQATVSWTAPGDDGGSAITGFLVTAADTTTPGNGNETCATSGATGCTVTQLTNGDAYTFSVTASNAVGPSPSSTPSASVTPATVPGAPTGVTATPLSTEAQVSWVSPSSDGGSAITGFTVTAADLTTSANGNETCTTSGATTCAVTELTNGDSYTFSVRAANDVGAGTASTASAAVTPATVPGSPTGVTAVAEDAAAKVSWTAPSSDGGSAITGYAVTGTDTTTPADPGGGCTSTPGVKTCTVAGLNNGDAYYFVVTATNAVGAGNASAHSNAVTPATVPGAPTNVNASGGDGTAHVTWSAPGSTGGSPITGYTVAALDTTTSGNGARAAPRRPRPGTAPWAA